MTSSFPCDVAGCDKICTSERFLRQHQWMMHEGGRERMAEGRRRKAETGQAATGYADDQPADDSPFSEVAPVFDLEIPPTPPTWREKIWGPNSKEKKPAAPGERRPRKRRQSTEGVWTAIWTAAGAALVQTGADIPVGNCMSFQAPIVGEILDEAVAGTFLDTLLQPIAGAGGRLKKVSSVVSMPILVGIMERSPQAAVTLEPLLRQVIREHLVALAPQIKARQKADEQYAKALVELGMEVGDDPIDAVISAIFPAFGAPETNGVGAHVAAS